MSLRCNRQKCEGVVNRVANGPAARAAFPLVGQVQRRAVSVPGMGALKTATVPASVRRMSPKMDIRPIRLLFLYKSNGGSYLDGNLFHDILPASFCYGSVAESRKPAVAAGDTSAGATEKSFVSSHTFSVRPRRAGVCTGLSTNPGTARNVSEERQKRDRDFVSFQLSSHESAS